MNSAISYQLEDREFDCLRRLVHEQTGITMDDSKRQLVISRIGRRLRSLELSSFAEYCDLVCDSNADELQTFINALTTNLTYFFREPAHFEHLVNVTVPKWRREKRRDGPRIWSAGCSSGEEAYSVAMSLAEAVGDTCNWRVLATDVDSRMLDTARSGIYSLEKAERMPADRLARWFLKGAGVNAGRARVRETLRQRVAFRQLNLIRDWPMKKPFDAIFCRNVVIYFDRETQARLFARFADQLMPGGLLYLGHSETLFKASDRFRLVDQTTYQKIA